MEGNFFACVSLIIAEIDWLLAVFYFQFGHITRALQEVQTQRTDGLRNSDTCQVVTPRKGIVTDGGYGVVGIIFSATRPKTLRNDEPSAVGVLTDAAPHTRFTCGGTIGDGGGVVCFVQDVPDTIHLRSIQCRLGIYAHYAGYQRKGEEYDLFHKAIYLFD